MNKKPFWLTPYPVLIVNAYKKLLPQREKKERSPRGIRRLLCVLAIVSVVLIWVVEGFVNPLEYLVDMPALSLLESVDAYPGQLGSYYYMCLLGVTAVMMNGLKHFVCGEKDLPIWTVNGVLYWLTGLAVAILADAVARNIIMDRMMVPGLQGGQETAESVLLSIVSLLLVHFLAYFAFEDFAGNSMAALLTPYAIVMYNKVFEPVGFMDVQLVKYLILTLVLKLFLIILDKLGIAKLLSKLLIGLAYVVVPVAMFGALAIPILPYILVWWLVRRKMKENTEQKA